MKIKFLTLFVVLTICNWMINPVFGNTDLLENYRIFPELENVHIHKIIYKDINSILIWGKNNNFFKWTGKNWRKIQILSRFKNHIVNFFPYDSTHYLLSVQPHENYYHSKLVYFNDKRWLNIPSLQPYIINSVSYIDENTFWCGGLWGSLLFYDGQNSKVIAPYAGCDFNKLKAFKRELFIVMASKEGYIKNTLLLKYHKNRWTKLLPSDTIDLKDFYFWSPDSGFVFDKKGRLYLYNNGELIKLSSLMLKPQFVTYSPETKKIFYWHKKAFWNISPKGQIQKLFKFPLPAQIFPLHNNDYFVYSNDQVFYRGKRNFGQIISRTYPRFNKNIFSLRQHLSVGVYRFQDGAKGLYFSKPLEINSFQSIFFDSTTSLPPHFNKIKNRFFTTGIFDFVGNKYLWDAGISFGDLDNDGDRDAILSNLKGSLQIFENVGNDRFKNITKETELNIRGRLNLIHLVDLDLDGYLDFVVGDELGPMRFVHNKGFMRFEKITSLFKDSLITYLPAFADLDGDADADLIAYSQFKSLRYFENVGLTEDGFPRYVERSEQSPDMTTHFDFFTQSVSFADYDNDGDLDVLLANRNAYLKLFENKGNFYFKDVSKQKRIHYSFLAYGASWGDLNQDGYQDFVLTTLGENYIFWNHKGQYFQIDSSSFAQNYLSYTTGSAIDDIDEDGDLDIVLSNFYIDNDALYFNLLNQKSFIKIKFLCKSKNNFEGIGSSIYLFQMENKRSQEKLVGYRYIRPETGFNSYALPIAYFGVKPNQIYKAIIKYPGGTIKQIVNLKPGKTYLIREPNNLNLIANMLFYTKQWIFRKSYRDKFLDFIFLIVLLAVFNIYIKRRTYWPTIHIIFYNTFLISIYLIGKLIDNFFHFSALITFLYFFIIAGIGAFFLVEKYTTFKFSNIYRYEIFDLLRQFHHGKNGFSQIDHLIFYCNNLNQSNSPQILPKFLHELEHFQNYTLPFVKNVLIKAARLKELRSLSEKTLQLVHLLKQKVIQQETNPFWGSKELFHFKNNLLNLKNNLIALRQKHEISFSCNVLEIITQNLRRFTNFSEVHIQNKTNSKEPFAIIPPESLSLILNNLFQNALEAMKSSSKKKLEIKINRNYNKIIIDISDSGTGVAPHLQEKIFEENFSTKNSSGLGLYHVRKTLKRFGGQISLVQSKNQKGATFRLTLRGIENVQNKDFND